MERDFKDERADAGKTREIQIFIFKTERKEVNRRFLRKEGKQDHRGMDALRRQ